MLLCQLVVRFTISLIQFPSSLIIFKSINQFLDIHARNTEVWLFSPFGRKQIYYGIWIAQANNKIFAIS